ncbi:MAG: hydrolase 2, exosortase A system-associated [Pseudomonadota bacterium]
MTASTSPPPSRPFFLPVSTGQRFCLYHAPSASSDIHAALVYVHPFGEEMNRSRRIAALQARAFAAAGVAVLQIDLHGCGDSSGDFADARWQSWIDDLALAHGWLAEQVTGPVGLWGLRLGVLLMLDYARQARRPIDRFICWHPVMNGQAWLTQWLRLRLAGQMLDGDSGRDPAGGMQTLRATLAQGRSLEIAGYELAPDLAAAIDAVDGLALAPAGYRVDWFDIATGTGKPVTPAVSKAIAEWQRQQVGISHQQVVGQAFWALPEITSCPSLIDATLAAFHTNPA